MLQRFKIPLKLSSIGAIGASLLMAPSAFAQDDIPDLTGAWNGHAIGGAHFGELQHDEPTEQPVFKDVSMPWTLTIERQDGRGLIGTWASPQHSELLVGVIRSDNRTVYFVDEDTHFDATIIADGQMELCARETGFDSMVAACFIIERQ